MATLLDPRFKDNFFSGNIIRATVREVLVDEMTQLTSSPVTISENVAEEPGPSHPKRTCPVESTVLLDVISEIITDSNGNTPSTTTDLENFLNDSLLDYKSGNPYTWWGQNKTQFPILLVLAQHYLCPGPPTGGVTGALCPGPHFVGGLRKASSNGPHSYIFTTHMP